MTAFRVFLGWDSRQAEAAEVFAYSVRENSSIDVEVRALRRVGFYVRAEPVPAGMIATEEVLTLNGFTREGVTQFSYSRFLVPWFCGYEGVALFADGCDMLCLGDVAELASFDLAGKPLAVVKHPPLSSRPGMRARSWSSLMLMDCSKLQWWTPAHVETADDNSLMRFGGLGDESIGELPPEWNAMCAVPGEPPSGTKIAHWSALSNPEGGSWIDRSGSTVWAEWRQRWRVAR